MEQFRLAIGLRKVHAGQFCSVRRGGAAAAGSSAGAEAGAGSSWTVGLASAGENICSSVEPGQNEATLKMQPLVLKYKLSQR